MAISIDTYRGKYRGNSYTLFWKRTIFFGLIDAVKIDVDNIAENIENMTAPKPIQRIPNIRDKVFEGRRSP